MDLYRTTLKDTGYDDATIAQNVSDLGLAKHLRCRTDAEAERIGVPAFTRQHEFRAEMRKRVYKEQGVRLREENPGLHAMTPRMD